MSQRILHIIDSLRHTGSAHQLVLLATALVKQGFDVHVAALDRGGPLAGQLNAHNVGVQIIGRRFAFDPIALLRLRRHIALLRPSVVHTWSYNAAHYYHAAICLLRGRGREGTAAQPWSREPPAKPLHVFGAYEIDHGKSAWQWLLDRQCARSAHRIVTNSKTVHDSCVANGLPANKMTLIPMGVAPARPSDVSREALLRELGLPADAKLIGIIGRLTPEKRVRDLIWAADLLRVLHDNLRVLVIGDGPLRAQLERYARLASDLEHIRFLGERDDVWRILPHLDVLWNGSDNVRTSVAILEAMAAGVPVIASDVPVNRELIVEGVTGYLIPIGSRAGRAARARHTDRIFTDRQLASSIGATACQGVMSKYSLDRMIEKYMEMYEGLTAEAETV